jgi:hypothetical protein
VTAEQKIVLGRRHDAALEYIRSGDSLRTAASVGRATTFDKRRFDTADVGWDIARATSRAVRA